MLATYDIVICSTFSENKFFGLAATTPSEKQKVDLPVSGQRFGQRQNFDRADGAVVTPHSTGHDDGCVPSLQDDRYRDESYHWLTSLECRD